MCFDQARGLPQWGFQVTLWSTWALLMFGEMFCVYLVWPLGLQCCSKSIYLPICHIVLFIIKGYIRKPLIVVRLWFPLLWKKHALLSLCLQGEIVRWGDLSGSWGVTQVCMCEQMEIILHVYFRAGVLDLYSADSYTFAVGFWTTCQSTIFHIYSIYVKLFLGKLAGSFRHLVDIWFNWICLVLTTSVNIVLKGDRSSWHIISLDIYISW